MEYKTTFPLRSSVKELCGKLNEKTLVIAREFIYLEVFQSLCCLTGNWRKLNEMRKWESSLTLLKTGKDGLKKKILIYRILLNPRFVLRARLRPTLHADFFPCLFRADSCQNKIKKQNTNATGKFSFS